MGFVQTNATLPVELTVTRYRTFQEDGMVELWGYIGDYEVCVHLSLDDDRVRPLLNRPRSPRSAQEPNRG